MSNRIITTYPEWMRDVDRRLSRLERRRAHKASLDTVTLDATATYAAGDHVVPTSFHPAEVNLVGATLVEVADDHFTFHVDTAGPVVWSVREP